MSLPALEARADAAQDGDAAMRAGQYDVAVVDYQTALEQGDDSAQLHYNLGLAYVHQDALSQAIFHMMQAAYLGPWEDAYRQGVALVRAEQNRRRTERESVGETVAHGEPESLFWLDVFHRISRPVTELIIVGLSWLTFVLLMWRRRLDRSGRRDALTVLAVLAALLLLHAVAYRVGADLTKERIQPAVVVAESPRVWEAPDRMATRRSDRALFDGATVLVRESRGEWAEIELVTGTTGWVPEDYLQEVRVP